MPVTILDPRGKELAKTLVPLGEDASLTFLTNVAGVYQAVCQPGRHTVQIALLQPSVFPAAVMVLRAALREHTA